MAMAMIDSLVNTMTVPPAALIHAMEAARRSAPAPPRPKERAWQGNSEAEAGNRKQRRADRARARRAAR